MRCSRRHLSRLGLLLLAVASLCGGQVWAQKPRLTVQETAALARHDWPVTIGVPLPKGWLGRGQQARVEVSGQPIATQARPLAHWGDGSARWLLVDFQTDLSPRQRRELEVGHGTSPAPQRKANAAKSGSDVHIDTGAVGLLAGPGSGGVFRLQSVLGSAVQVGPARFDLLARGKEAPAAPPDSVEIEESGPLRVSVVLRGRYLNGFAYEVRLQAFAGQPFVRVLHTFINASDELINANDDTGTPMGRLRMHMPWPGAGKRTYSALARSAAPITGEVGAQGTSLVQVDASTYRRDGETRTGRLEGWFELRAGDAAVGLDARFFWQEFPQAVRFGPAALSYEMWAEGEGTAGVGVGAAKTHEFFLVFGTRGKLVAEPGRGVSAFTDPGWTASSGALLNAADPGREREFITRAVAAFERSARSIDKEVWDEAGACAPPLQEIRRTGAYGMFNWGDWNFRGYHDDTKGCDAWGNQEYDLTQVLGLLYAASGRPDVWESLVAAARHFGDVDVIYHQPKRPEFVGMNHPKNPRHFSFEYGGVDLGHTWVEGLFTYHFLTGETRAFRAATGISDYLLRRLRLSLKGNPRQFGWPALALSAAYEATGRAEYRDAGREYARLGTVAHRVPADIANNWKLGILADGVSYAHAITGDAGLRDWLVAYAAAVARSRPKDVRFYPAVAYVGRLTNDGALRELARAAAGRAEFGGWYKPFTITGRSGFRILAQVD